MTGVPAKARPSSSAVRRAPDDHRAYRLRPAPVAPQRGFGATAPAADGAGPGPLLQRQRPGAVPATGDGAATPTGEGGDISAPRHLDQHRRAGLQRRAGGAQRDGRNARGARRRVALVGVAGVVEGDHPRGAGPHHRPCRDDVVRPSAAHQRLGLGGAGVATDQRRAAGLMRAQHRHLTGVRIRRTRLGQAVVGVGPDHDQPQVAQRREHRAAGADHQPRAAPQRRKPAPVARGRPQARRQRDHAAFVDQRGRGPPQRVQVSLIGHDRQRRPSRADGLGGGLGESVRPRITRQRLPDGAGGARLGQGAQEPPALAVALPARRVDARDHGQCGGRRGFPLHPGVPGRHRQPQHVRPGPGVARRHGVDQSADFGREHRFGGHHAIEPAQLAGVVGVVAALQHKAVDQPAVEPHPHPHPRLGIVGLLGRHQVVELAVQVWHRQHR